jgi:predicted metal-dependent phosphoesterase TrpH
VTQEGRLREDFVDLHCHSTASDGTLAPAEVIGEAHCAGLSALSLTDHDTVAGIDEAHSEAKKLGIDFLPGIEISCQYPAPGTMHLLGYGVDPHSAALHAMMHNLVLARNERNRKIIDALQRLGIIVTLDDVQREAGGDVIGRPHIARALVRKGFVSSIKQAFDKFLAQGRSAYFDKERLTPRQAIDLIHSAGGLIVLAHPVQLRAHNSAQLERAIKDLKDQGLDGLEVIHSDHDDAMIDFLDRLADKLYLLKTGGSDFHGSNKPDVQLGFAGKRRVPRRMFDALMEAL